MRKDRSIQVFWWLELLWAFEDMIHDSNFRIYYYGLGLGDYFVGLVSLKRRPNGKSRR